MRRHDQRLFRLARAVLGNDADAEDALQESYVSAYSRLAQFRGEAPVVNWLSRICLHHALRARRGRAEPDRSNESVEAAATDETPLSDLLASELRRQITEAIDGLPMTHRAVLVLRLVEGLSTRETARTLEISESAVKVNLLRARRAVLDRLHRRGFEHIRECFSFAGERCDRIVRTVLARLENG